MGDSNEKVLVLLADGFEEIEALTVVDLLRRAGIVVETLSIKEGGEAEVVNGARGIPVIADGLFDAGQESEYLSSASTVVLPGGMPGTINLKEHQGVRKVVTAFYEGGKYVAAICAAPTVLGDLGILEGKSATCYPGMEDGLNCANAVTDGQTVVVDGKVITSRGLGTAIDFSLKLIEILKDKAIADKIGASVVYNV